MDFLFWSKDMNLCANLKTLVVAKCLCNIKKWVRLVTRRSEFELKVYIQCIYKLDMVIPQLLKHLCV